MNSTGWNPPMGSWRHSLAMIPDLSRTMQAPTLGRPGLRPDDAPVTGGTPEAAMDNTRPKHNVVNEDDRERLNTEVQALLASGGYADYRECDDTTATKVVAALVPFVPITGTAVSLQPAIERASMRMSTSR